MHIFIRKISILRIDIGVFFDEIIPLFLSRDCIIFVFDVY